MIKRKYSVPLVCSKIGSYYSWPIKEEIINLDFLILLSIKKDNNCCQPLLIALVHGKEMIKCKYKL